MTPTAVTPSPRGKTKARGTNSPKARAASAPGSRAGGHRSAVRMPASPKAPRRVSGPLGGVSRTRRVSGPGRSAPAGTLRSRRAVARGSLSIRAAAFVRALPEHRLLDRIVRGRAWIPMLGILLAGIVAMQVEVLKFGASMGRSIERTTALQSQNELLRASVARLADDQRIESRAAAMGMVMPAPDAIGFMSLRPNGYVQRAAASIHAPNAASFIASLPATAIAASSASTAVTSPSTSGAPSTTATGTPSVIPTGAPASISTGAPSTIPTAAPATSNGG